MKKTSEELEILFQALGDRTRLRLLNLMYGGEVCVCFFVEVLHMPQPRISRHLAFLRDAGLVAGRREGKWVHYSVTFPRSEGARKIVEHLLMTLADDDEMRRDRAKLANACCSTRVSDLLQRAPKPEFVAALRE